MLTYCDVIDTRADRQQLWRHNDRLFRRGCYGRFLSTTHASDELCTCLVLNWSGVWQSDWQRVGIIIFSCDQAALWMVFSVCLSVCLSVRLSVCPSHLFDYVPIIVSSWNFQELSPRTRVTSMQKVKVRGQRSRSQRSQPNFTVSGL